MTLDDNATYYDILDLKPDASPQEVRDAYLRTKATYNRDSVALYSLVSPEEREDMLARIEQAYEVLSNPEKRKQYDLHYGILDVEQNVPLPSRAPFNKKIISIDRVPPMEGGDESDLLVAPTTDFGADDRPEPRPSTSAEDRTFLDEPAQARREREPAPRMESPAAMTPPPMNRTPVEAARAEAVRRERAIHEEIAQETEFRGSFLKKIRENRRISIEEMANITKINKSYLLALEDENFQKLPATVFVRGFVTQVAKNLKLPHEKVVLAYMARYSQARPEKAR